MARKTDKKKPSRNVLVVAEKKTKGRGKNKTTEVKAKRGKLGTRLYCVLLTPKAKGADRKKAKYSCFASFEEASVALLAAAPLPANPALAEMLKMQATAGMRGRRRGLRALPAGLRGTPEEHRERYDEYMEDFRQRLARHGGSVEGLSPSMAFELFPTLERADIESGWVDDLPRSARRDLRDLHEALYQRVEAALAPTSGERWGKYAKRTAKNVDKDFLLNRGVTRDEYNDEFLPPASRFNARR